MVLPIALAAAGSSLLGGIGGILGGGAKKKQTKNALNDLNAARDQGMTALGDARDAGIGYLSGYNDLGGVGAAGVKNMLTPGYDYQSSDPGYGYIVDQMQNATERGAAAAGGVQSGGFFKALQRNAAGIAAQDYGNAFNRNFQTAGLGLNAANSMAQTQSNYGSNAANLLSTIARAKVPVYTERGDAIAGQFGSAFGGLQGAIGSYFGF